MAEVQTAPAIGTPEYDTAMIAKADALYAEVTPEVTPEAKPEEQSQEEQRPEWLPSKFKSPEDMARAYAELEKTQSQKAAPKTEQDPAEQKPEETPEEKPEGEEQADPAAALAAVGVDYNALNDEFQKSGTLSPESYEALEKKAGLSKDYVDSYIAGQQALAREAQQRAFDIAGGEAEYSNMIKWAGANLTPNEIKAFDQAVEGSAEQVALAVAGLRSKYIVANGSEPKLLDGGAITQAGTGFASRSEMTEAMRDPRYAKDPAYRKQVETKIGNSTF